MLYGSRHQQNTCSNFRPFDKRGVDTDVVTFVTDGFHDLQPDVRPRRVRSKESK